MDKEYESIFFPLLLTFLRSADTAGGRSESYTVCLRNHEIPGSELWLMCFQAVPMKRKG